MWILKKVINVIKTFIKFEFAVGVIDECVK